MQEQLTPDFGDYELLDTGDFEKLERFGRYVTRRPEPQAIWRRSLAEEEWRRMADASFRRDARSDERGEWRLAPGMPDRWVVEYAYKRMRLRMRLGLTSFKHVGIFPEQAANWNFIYDNCRALAGDGPTDGERVAAVGSGVARGGAPKVLNLFAYTGGATLAAAAAGASVTHVDASKGMVTWAKENAVASGLGDAPIRWLVDDCVKFVEREIRRGNHYDGIIMDPPSYGRGPSGEIWKLEKDLFPFLKLVSGVLSDDPLFFIINSYTTGLAPSVLTCLLDSVVTRRFGGGTVSDELGLPVTDSGLVLPCGATGRWTREGRA